VDVLDSTFAMPNTITNLDEGNDNVDWESVSDGSDDEDRGVRITIPPLLPVPPTLTSSTDQLCPVCKALNLTARQFVVLPGDNETENKPDDPTFSLGLFGDMLQKPHCPFCRLAITALGGPDVSAFEDGEPVVVTMSWTTEGPAPDANQPWNHTPQIRLLALQARTQSGGFLRSTRLNQSPTITLLANDAPTPLKAFFVRPINEAKIDFGMVKNWILMCENWHGRVCDRSKLGIHEHEFVSQVDRIPAFRLIDVVDNCVIQSPRDVRYVALSYVWGKEKFLTAVTSNIERLEKPGALQHSEFRDRMPATIRDAMQVVRELDMKYLWVDSLCIVQDDDTGSKEDSISKMDHVYGDAFLTIYAATGNAANAGLPGVLPGTRGQRQPIEEIAPRLRLAFKQRYQNYIKDSAYYTRAWMSVKS
jgi:hypothetical protein